MVDNVVVEVSGPDVVIVETGFPGPPGLSAYHSAVANGFFGTEVEWLASLVGTPGLSGSFYEHQQSAASVTWTINHNFGRHAFVSLYTTGGAQIIGQVTNINANQSIAAFDTPIAGYAIAI
jgi:uncharacterized membrane protein YkgB